MSAFGYGYDAGGSITRWTQSQPFHTVEPMSGWTIEQDAENKLDNECGDTLTFDCFI